MNTSVMSPFWVGGGPTKPVPLSPVSQRLIQQAGSFDAAARLTQGKLSPVKAPMPEPAGGGMLRSPFPFTPKPLDSTAMSYMKGARRVWDSPQQRAGWALANSPFGQYSEAPEGTTRQVKRNFGL